MEKKIKRKVGKKCKYQKLVLPTPTTSIQVVYRHYQAICDLNFISKLVLYKFA